MLQILQFIFSSFWIWLGTFILLGAPLIAASLIFIIYPLLCLCNVIKEIDKGNK
jgi:hypothetical protein